ncbi:MAG: OprO/OprP family phosphate-selective porin [Cognaticolwellia sp.]
MVKVMIFSLAILFVTQVNAKSDLTLLLGVLKENGTITEKQYQALISVRQESQLQTKAPIKEPVVAQAKIAVKNGLKVSSADEAFSLHIGGRVEAHAAWYNSNDFDLADGSEMRRVRLFLKGSLYHDWRYKLDYDFVAGGTKGIKDAFLAYHLNDSTQLIAGNYKVPFSLEFQASSHANTFIERSLAFGLSPGRHLGTGINLFKDDWSLQAGVFGNKINQSNTGQDEETLIASRLVWVPVKDDDYFVHLGVAALRSNNGDNDILRFKSNPESYVANTQLVDTGSIATVEDYSQLGFELAMNYERLNVQGEYIQSSVHTKQENLDFNSWYIQSSLFLTNDRRFYKKGKFGIVKPQSILGKNGSGAWEVAMRYSELDLSDGSIFGGIEKNMTLALNLYATPEIRFTAEYLRVLDVINRDLLEGNVSLNSGQVRLEWVF